MAHVSACASVACIASKRDWSDIRLGITCEVTPHHLTFSEDYLLGHNWENGARLDRLNTSTKVNPPLRTEYDRRSLFVELLKGNIDCFATDHALHCDADKNVLYAQAASGISNIETALGSLMVLVHR